jgi:hypothetical protein
VAVERAGDGLLDQDVVLVTAAAPEVLTTLANVAKPA